MLLLGTASAVLALSGSGVAARPVPVSEVVVTLKAPPLSRFGRALFSARHETYARQLTAARVTAERQVVSAIPSARIRWQYSVVANGFAVVVPKSELARLSSIPSVERVWPNVRYHALLDRSPEVIGADKLWGPTFATAGNGMKIGIIDDGVDATHPFFNPSGFSYPAGFPKGQTAFATPKVIVQRTFPPPSPQWKYASRPFDPANSFHATHVAGIAAGEHGTIDAGRTLSGVAPNAQIGNYKALTIPTPGFGLDGNAAEIAAAIEAAVKDGMNVINLSLGEPEIDVSRDLVVKAIEGAAAAGVVPVIAAGNDFSDFGFGSVSSPGSAPSAITVAAATKTDRIADFSSAGPTPVSLQMKPDVTAPGVAITSSLPASEGLWGPLQGTSMASPHVAGAAALLLERHPAWTPAQVKSALVQTGDPVKNDAGAEVPATREGGGMVDLPRADNPLLFASPTGVSFGLLEANGTATRSVDLTDAGGGAGTWSVSVSAEGPLTVSAPSTVTVPGRLEVSASAVGTATADASGFVVLTRATDVRRIPLWGGITAKLLAREPARSLSRPGVYSGTTVGGAARVDAYRYPTAGDGRYGGSERVFTFRVGAPVANLGVTVLKGRVVPHVVIGRDESHLAGYPGLPFDLNPYREQYGTPRNIAGVVLPTPGEYSIVFETTPGIAPGPFSFRLWSNDTSPPRLRVLSTSGRRIVVSATDAGAGLDPVSLVATLDGKRVNPAYRAGRVTIAAAPGRHRLVLSAADFQETKNMEDVVRILPNTATLTRILTVR